MESGGTALCTSVSMMVTALGAPSSALIGRVVDIGASSLRRSQGDDEVVVLGRDGDGLRHIRPLHQLSGEPGLSGLKLLCERLALLHADGVGTDAGARRIEVRLPRLEIELPAVPRAGEQLSGGI